MRSETMPARPGEELIVENLAGFLRARYGSAADKLEVRQFPSGSSNLTYLLSLGADEYVLRRPPFGNRVKSAHDMRREFDVLSKLSLVYAPAPKPSLYCEDESVIGSIFYVMERRRGLIIRGKLSELSPVAAKFNASLEYQSKVCRAFVKNLADLHALDYQAAGLGDLGKPAGYNLRQVSGWTKRYFEAKTDNYPELEAAIGWLDANVPAESGAALIHNDYKFDNVMLDADDLGHITAVLDWEMVTIGDPLMDFGTSLGYWMSADVGDELLSMPFNPRVLMENFSRKQLVEMYEQAVGYPLPDMLFYYVFGTFKIAVIAQQIYARFVRGFTNDERFANFDRFVAALGQIAERALAKGSI